MDNMLALLSLLLLAFHSFIVITHAVGTFPTSLSDLKKSYHYIVVGAGTSGAVLAARLTENPNVRVLVIEAGRSEPTVTNSDVVGLHVNHRNTPSDWQYQTQPQNFSHFGSRDRVGRLSSGKVLGGSSVTNGLLYARGCRADYDTWASKGCHGWDFDSVLPYFLKSEQNTSPDLRNSEFHSSAGFLGVSDSKNAMLSDVFVHAGVQLGFNATDYNGKQTLGFSPFFGTFKNGRRTTTWNDLLFLVRHRTNLHVLVNAIATRIVFDQNFAKGVVFIKNGQEYTVKCDSEVLVSSGAIGSAKLLMLSGVGQKEHLTSLGIPVVADLPVGQNLQDHLMFPVWADTAFPGYVKTASSWDWFQYNAFNAGKLTEPTYSGTAFFKSSKDISGKPEVMMNMAPYKMSLDQLGMEARGDILQEVAAAAEGPGITFVLSLLNPKSRGDVKLRSSNPYDQPVIDPKYLQDEEDAPTIAGSVDLVVSLLRTKSFKLFNFSVTDPNFSFCDTHLFNSTNYWVCLVRHLAVSMNHPVGTCRMGDPRDPSSVVDPQMRVVGTKGLRVVDSSIVPEITTGSSNAVGIMIAEKAADLLKGEAR